MQDLSQQHAQATHTARSATATRAGHTHSKICHSNTRAGHTHSCKAASAASLWGPQQTPESSSHRIQAAHGEWGVRRAKRETARTHARSPPSRTPTLQWAGPTGGGAAPPSCRRDWNTSPTPQKFWRAQLSKAGDKQLPGSKLLWFLRVHSQSTCNVHPPSSRL